jgi:hypothetical protein
MLSDERAVACLIPISTPILPGQRPAVLDQQKATGRSKIAACYEHIIFQLPAVAEGICQSL